jgi:predicted DNA-binding antitoxin AbrB/MazE fold protein
MTKSIQAVFTDGHIRPLQPLELPEGTSLRILVDAPVSEENVEQPSACASKASWELFRSLGRDAQPGPLVNPSVEHDRHLYGQQE